ncbi:MAG: trehalase, partial [Bacteroidetes bacterium]
FAYLIDLLGFIPNGNRTYFLSRSQPPFFAAMVKLLAAEREDYQLLVKYLPQLEKEYRFWMRNAQTLSADNPHGNRVVWLADGSILNRYWDDSDSPRPEMYATDLEQATKAQRYGPHMFREIRAACESGWDFSARWFADGQHLSTINCTAIIPVDLNALLYHLEETIATAHRLAATPQRAAFYAQRASQRLAAINRYCWDEQLGFYRDYNFVNKSFTPILSLAAAFPLYFELATPEQAQKVVQQLEQEFLQAGGLVSTLNLTGEQWDAPNGWAPLQWIAIQGLRHYGYHQLANTIKARWIEVNVRVFQRTGKIVEKYNVVDIGSAAGGGEYPLQDGFGWSNGVLLRLLRE